MNVGLERRPPVRRDTGSQPQRAKSETGAPVGRVIENDLGLRALHCDHEPNSGSRSADFSPPPLDLAAVKRTKVRAPKIERFMEIMEPVALTYRPFFELTFIVVPALFLYASMVLGLILLN